MGSRSETIVLAIFGCVAIVAMASIFGMAALGIAPTLAGPGSIFQGLWGNLATAFATIVGAFAVYIGGTRALQSTREQILAEDRRRARRRLRKAQVLAADRIGSVDNSITHAAGAAHMVGQFVFDLPSGNWHNTASTMLNHLVLPDICSDQLKTIESLGAAIVELRGYIRAEHVNATASVQYLRAIREWPNYQEFRDEAMRNATRNITAFERELARARTMLMELMRATDDSPLRALKDEIDTLS